MKRLWPIALLALPALALLASSPPAPNDFAAWYHRSGSLFQFDGPAGPIWKSSSELMEQTLLSQHTPAAAWFGSSVGETIVRSSLVMLTLQLKYHSHGNVLGTTQ